MQEISEQISIGDTYLFVRRIGRGDPVLVIHGGPGLNHNYLLPYLDRLSATNEIIYFDQRYCGISQNNIDISKIEVSQFIEDIESLRKALGLKHITLLAHSFGAHLAFRYAIAHPHNVKKIISLCGLSISWVGVGIFAKEFLRRTKSIKPQLDEIRGSLAFIEGDPVLHSIFYKLIFSTYCYDPSLTDNLQLSFTKEGAKNGLFVSYRLRTQLFTERFDLTNDLNLLNIPILMIHGTADPFPAEKVREAVSQLKAGHYLEFDKCGHFPFMEKPEPFVEAVSRFLVEGSVKPNALMAFAEESEEVSP